jgi:hypothetical protein
MISTFKNKTRIARMNVQSAQSVFMFTKCRVIDPSSYFDFNLPNHVKSWLMG